MALENCKTSISLLLFGLLTTVPVGGCSSDPKGGSSDATGGAGGSGGSQDGSGGLDGGAGANNSPCVRHEAACTLTECEVPSAGGDHVQECSPLSYNSNPPTSGAHYGVWAAFEKYDEPVPRGYWIHSMEHSAVILTYNCDRAEEAGLDCETLVDELSAFFDEWESDPLCTATRHRLLLTPDPLLDVAFAAAAWGHYLKGNCWDEELLAAFIRAHYGQNYENICNAGIDPSSAPAGCGD